MTAHLLSCPLCSATLRGDSLEGHLRQELDYLPYGCRLCTLRFPTEDAAECHFRGPFAKHGAAPASLSEARDVAAEQRLLRLLRQAQASTGQPDWHCSGCRCGDGEGDVEAWKASPGTLQEQTHGSRGSVEPYAPRPLSLKRDFGVASELEEPSHGPGAAKRKAPKPISWEATPAFRAEPEASWQPEAELLSSVEEMAAAPSFPLLKAEASEERAALREDGRAACAQCGAVSAKKNFVQHVVSHHLSAARFHCNHCDYQAKHRQSIQQHCGRTHGLAKDAEGAFTELNLKKEIDEGVEASFGRQSDIPNETRTCRSCRETVESSKARQHIIAQHLGRPMHSCRLCDFASYQLSTSEVARHVRKAHGAAMSGETVQSDAETHGHVVRKMVAELFD